jgi:hypothetical protein
MAHIFYDRVVALDHIEKELGKLTTNKEEKEELVRIIDEYIHHRMLGCILGKLPHEHHEPFLTQFTESPHHEGLWDFLKTRIGHDIEEFLKLEASLIGQELIGVIKGKASPKVTKKTKKKN